MEREGRKKGDGRRRKERENERRNGLFWGKKAGSDPKLLPVIHELLTTTGCGHQPVRPQPMVLRHFSVK
jgi:hypothetical protein